MTKLLISVKDIQEAKIISSYTNIIDFKNPLVGPLGGWRKREILSAVNILGDTNKLSATIGNISDNSEILKKIISYDSLKLDFIKIGIFKDSTSYFKNIIKSLNSRNFKTKLVYVFFVENKNIINFVRKNFSFLKKNKVNFFLIDTMNKSSGGLLSQIPIDILKNLTDLSKQHDIKIGLAGKIKNEEIKDIVSIRPFVIGVRSAICKNIDRKLSVSEELSRQLYYKFKSEIKNAHAVAGA